MAGKLESKKENDLALAFVHEAMQSLEKVAEGEPKLYAQLELVRLLARLDAPNAFDLVRRAVERVNQFSEESKTRGSGSKEYR